MKLIDDFLIEKEFKSIQDLLTSPNFSWYYQKDSVPGDNLSHMSHLFCEFDKINSDFFKYISPILNKLNVKSILRIKANLTLNRNKVTKSPYHTDHLDTDLKHTTAIMYINTCNGYTEFKKPKKKVLSVENRLFKFKSNNPHRAVSQTDTDARIVLNINYI